MCEFCKTLRVFGIFRSTSYSSFCMFLLEYQCLTVKKRLRTCKCKQNGTTGKRIIKSDSFKLQLCCHVYPYGLSSISRSSLANRLSSLISCEDNMDNSIGRRWKKHEEAYSGELEWKLLVEDWLNPSKSFFKTKLLVSLAAEFFFFSFTLLLLRCKNMRFGHTDIQRL